MPDKFLLVTRLIVRCTLLSTENSFVPINIPELVSFFFHDTVKLLGSSLIFSNIAIRLG